MTRFLCETFSPKCGKEGSGSTHGALGAIPKGPQAYFTEEGGEAGQGGRLLGLTPTLLPAFPPETPTAKPAHSWQLRLPGQVRFDITRHKAQSCSDGRGRSRGAIQSGLRLSWSL